MTKFNLFEKYGSDTSKEIDGVPFYLDKDSDCYIIVARWCARNHEHAKAQAELTTRLLGASEWEIEKARYEVFAKHLVKGWNNVYGVDGKAIEFSPENAYKLFEAMPDLADDVVSFSVQRKNYPIDTLQAIAKNQYRYWNMS